MVYFGTVDGPLAKMQEVPCMITPMTVTHTGYQNNLQFENGGVSVTRSVDSSKHVEMSYMGDDLFDGGAIDVVMDYYHGVYGDGLIYFDDPTIPRGQNVLRRNWATPALGEIGYQFKLDRGYPDSALYGEYVDVTAGYGSPGRALKIMRAGDLIPDPPNYATLIGRVVVPEGYTFYLMGRGELDGAYVLAKKVGATSASLIMSNLSPLGSNELYNGSNYLGTSNKVEGPAVLDVSIMVGGVDPDMAHVTIQSLDGIILPNGVTPPATGDHMVGRGASGYKFANDVPYDYISTETGLRSFSAELVEVGEWQND